MIIPDFKTFSEFARNATLVPVVKSVSADLLTPVSAFLSVAGNEPNAFLLESVEGGEKIGRHTFLGVSPYMQVSARAGKVEIVRGKKKEIRRANLFEVLRELLREHQVAQLPGLPPFTAGAVGFFSYDAVRQLEPIPTRAVDDLQ